MNNPRDDSKEDADWKTTWKQFTEGHLDTQTILSQLAEMPAVVRQQIAKAVDSDDLAKKLVKDPSHKVRLHLAGNTHLSATIYTELLQDKSSEVLLELSQNPSVPENVLLLLLDNSEIRAQIALAYREDLSKDFYSALLELQNRQVNVALASNPIMPLEFLIRLSKQDDIHIQLALAARLDLTTELLQNLVLFNHSEVFMVLLNNTTIYSSRIMDVWSEVKKLTDQDSFLTAFGELEYLPKNILTAKFKQGKDHEIMDLLVHNKHLSTNLVLHLLTHASDTQIITLLPNLSPNLEIYLTIRSELTERITLHPKYVGNTVKYVTKLRLRSDQKSVLGRKLLTYLLKNADEQQLSQLGNILFIPQSSLQYIIDQGALDIFLGVLEKEKITEEEFSHYFESLELYIPVKIDERNRARLRTPTPKFHVNPIHMELLSHPDLPQHFMVKFTQSNDPTIRQRLAMNPNLNFESLRRLALDDDTSIRHRIAARDNLSKEFLTEQVQIQDNLKLKDLYEIKLNRKTKHG